MVQPPTGTAGSSRTTDLWRYHHLIHQDTCPSLSGDHVLQTAGCLLRKAAILSVGNFDPSYRKDEDRQLGLRLLKAGWKVIQDPELLIYLDKPDGLWRLLMRYCRWNAPMGRPQTPKEYARQVAYALRHMAWQDMRHRRYGCMLISLLSPHILYAYSWYSWLKGKRTP
jgi:cellulose synthase/poly-beta-1,6-N-acetylglucosamine synthase-like glycosyltransferase